VRGAHLDGDQDRRRERRQLQIGAAPWHHGKPNRQGKRTRLDHTPQWRDPVVEAPDRERRRAIGLVARSRVPELVQPDVAGERQDRKRQHRAEADGEQEPLRTAPLAPPGGQ
jgi:hypothetical protein